MHYVVKLKSIQEHVHADDGARVLVDAALPADKAQSSSSLDEWYSKAAPSTTLRKALRKGEIPFAQFADAYAQELKNNIAVLTPLLKYLRRGDTTLLTASEDIQRSHLPVLKHLLLAQLVQEDEQADGAERASPTCYGGPLD